MRIAYLIHQYFPHTVGGTEIYARGLALRAVRAGHQVQIITCREPAVPEEDSRPLEHLKCDGLPVAEIYYNLGSYPDPARCEYDNPHVAQLAKRELEHFQPDVVHGLHAMKLSGATLKACYQLGIPVVFTLCDFWFICPRHTLLKWDGSLCRGPRHPSYCLRCLNRTHGFADARWVWQVPGWSLRPLLGLGLIARKNSPHPFWQDIRALRQRNRYLREVLLQARRIIALSPFLKRLYVENGFPADRIEVNRLGLEVENLTPVQRRPDSRLQVLFVGSIVYHKGLHVLLEALGRHRELEVDCLVYGALQDDVYSRRIRALAADDGRVQLCGTYLPEEENQVFGKSDLLVAPALWYENEPLIVKTALYLGIPVLASDIGSLPNMIRPDKDGWLVPFGDVAALGDALKRLALNRALLDIEPKQVKTMDKNAEEMLEIYQAITREKK